FPRLGWRVRIPSPAPFLPSLGTRNFQPLAGCANRRAAMEIGLVRSRRLELPRPFGHSDLNAARLPVPPRPHVMKRQAARTAAATGKAAPLAKAPLGRNAVPNLKIPVHIGTKVKMVFTIMNGRRYALVMLFAAAAIVAAS